MNKQVLAMKNEANKFLGYFVAHNADLTQYIGKACKVEEGSVEARELLATLTEEYERGDDEHFVLIRPEHCAQLKQVLVLRDPNGGELGYFHSERCGDTQHLKAAKEYFTEKEIKCDLATLSRDPRLIQDDLRYEIANVADCAAVVGSFAALDDSEDHGVVATPEEKGAALLSIATMMIKNRVTCPIAMSNAYFDGRVRIMNTNGIDFVRAEALLELGIEHLIN